MDTFSFVIVMVLCGICVLLASVPLLAVLGDKMFEKYKREYKEYEEYGSPKDLEEAWNNLEEIGECASCGVDDAPTTYHYYAYGALCIYCSELKNLVVHIRGQKSRNERVTYYY